MSSKKTKSLAKNRPRILDLIPKNEMGRKIFFSFAIIFVILLLALFIFEVMWQDGWDKVGY